MQWHSKQSFHHIIEEGKEDAVMMKKPKINKNKNKILEEHTIIM